MLETCSLKESVGVSPKISLFFGENIYNLWKSLGRGVKGEEEIDKKHNFSVMYRDHQNNIIILIIRILLLWDTKCQSDALLWNGATPRAWVTKLCIYTTIMQWATKLYQTVIGLFCGFIKLLPISTSERIFLLSSTGDMRRHV